MFGFVKIKTLWIGVLVALPAVIYWTGGIDGLSANHTRMQAGSQLMPSRPAGPPVVTIPVEVIATGKEPEWIFVQVDN